MNKTLDQSKPKSNTKNAPQSTLWDIGIADAQRRIAELKFSIKDFRKGKARGDRWLGESATPLPGK
jgi:hypothetical protein